MKYYQLCGCILANGPLYNWLSKQYVLSIDKGLTIETLKNFFKGELAKYQKAF